MFINLKIGGGIKERSESTIRYFNDIKDFPILSKKEENELLYKVHNGTEKEATNARNKLISCNQRFVVASAKRQMTPGIELVDLVNEANIGLMEAIDKFDPNKNSKLLSYAAYYIKRNIDQFKINYGKIVRKKNGERIYHHVAKVRSYLTQKLEREPTTEEISSLLNKKYGINIKNNGDVNEIRLTRIDNSNENEDNNESSQMDIYEFNRNTANGIEFNNEINNEYNSYKSLLLLKCLNKRESEIIRFIYGIDNNDIIDDDKSKGKYNYEIISKKYGLTKERVRQIHKESLQKMRKYIEGKTK